MSDSQSKGSQAAFFPRHDLTHYAVETVLGHAQGFYGTVAAGWDLSDFGTPWPRGKLPAVANLTELVVGFFDRERAGGHLGTAAELNEEIANFCAESGLSVPDNFSGDDLARVRERRGVLFTEWEAVRPGAALELPFDPGNLPLRVPSRIVSA